MPARILAPLVLILTLILPVSAQELQGNWQGVLKLPDSRQLHFVLHFRKEIDTRYSGFMSSPDQGVSDIPLGEVRVEGRELAFDVPSLNGAFKGTWDGKQWTGEWTQGGQKLALNLARASGLPVPGESVALAGDWDGVLDTGVTRLRVVVHVRVTKTGTFSSFDSIDQGAAGIPISAIHIDGAKVRIELQAISATFEGLLEASGQSINGRWSQGRGALPLSLSRRVAGAPEPALERPQTPKPPFPYREEEVVYDNPNGKTRLAGTLTLPNGTGPFSAVLLIAGSGPLDRDESLFGHKPFLVLADHLTRQGIAVLRVDKRGIGKSIGDFSSATTADFASDAEAGIAFLRARKDIKPLKIGLIGHSEGGMVAPMVMARDPSVAFAVLLAAPGISGIEIIVAQVVYSMRYDKRGEERYTQFAALLRKAFAAIAAAPDQSEAIARATQIMQSAMEVHDLSEEALSRVIASWSTNWFRYFLVFDPVPLLQKVKVPVLALNGSLDVQVRARENTAAIRKALAGNEVVEIHELTGLNHLFQTAKTGDVSEYGAITETFAPSALEQISKWIAARAR